MSKAGDLGLLALRLGFGGAAAAHGAQKLLGWFGGHGLDGTGAFFESVGFVPGKRNALFSGLCEGVGGAAIALGLGTGPAGAAMAGNMIVAGSTHAPNGFFGTNGGFELPATYGTVGSVLALTGGGRYSVDALTGRLFDKPWMRAVAYAGAVASAAYIIAERRKELASRPAPEPEVESSDQES